VVSKIPVTDSAIMHIGSITKVMTATLIMQLVDQGVLELDRRVVEYLPDFRLASEEAREAITVGMLLNHSSGIDGDLLPDMGHDQETIELAFSRFGNLNQIHRPAHGRAYCNPGFVIGGYLLQRLLGKSWYDLMKERIFTPLDMQHAAVLPEDALLYPASVGHFLDASRRRPVRTSHAFLPLSYAPAGSTAMMSASDLLAFTRAHLSAPSQPGQRRLLSQESATRMREHSRLSGGVEAFDCGIGWIRYRDFIRHGGGGPGIVSLIVAHPPSGTAAAVLTNAEYGSPAIAQILEPFFRSEVGESPFPSTPSPVDIEIDTQPYTGIYRNINTIHQVQAHNGRLSWASYSTQKYYDSSPMFAPDPTPLIPLGDHRFVADSRASTMPSSDNAVVSFAEPDREGRMSYLAENLWLFRRESIA
jgi:CubicO group peptidase (beta-lactamase class C family)